LVKRSGNNEKGFYDRGGARKLERELAGERGKNGGDNTNDINHSAPGGYLFIAQGGKGG